MLWFLSWEEAKLFADEVEKWISSNLSVICVLLVMYLTWILITKWVWFSVSLSYEFLYTMLWAIIAFWYTYKKYERDKEIEIISHLKEPENITELINDWHIKRILFEKWYIKSYVWEIIEANYQIKFDKHICILEDWSEINENTIIDREFIIRSLTSYESSKDYFIKQVELIEASLNCQVKFLKKLNPNDDSLKIVYYENLSRKVNDFLCRTSTNVETTS